MPGKHLQFPLTVGPLTAVPTDSCLHWQLSPLTVVSTDSCPHWQLSDLTVVRSDSCRIWQLISDSCLLTAWRPWKSIKKFLKVLIRDMDWLDEYMEEMYLLKYFIRGKMRHYFSSSYESRNVPWSNLIDLKFRPQAWPLILGKPILSYFYHLDQLSMKKSRFFLN